MLNKVLFIQSEKTLPFLERYFPSFSLRSLRAPHKWKGSEGRDQIAILNLPSTIHPEVSVRILGKETRVVNVFLMAQTMPVLCTRKQRTQGSPICTGRSEATSFP